MRPDPQLRLIRALADLAAGPVELVAETARPWSSVTFTGARHMLAIALSGEAADRLSHLDGDTLNIPGHVVADLAVVAREPHGAGTLLRIEALTIETG